MYRDSFFIRVSLTLILNEVIFFLGYSQDHYRIFQKEKNKGLQMVSEFELFIHPQYPKVLFEFLYLLAKHPLLNCYLLMLILP